VGSSGVVKCVPIWFSFWFHHSIDGLAHDVQNLYQFLLFRSLTLGSGFVGAGTLLLFFFCPETTYNRPDSSNIDLHGVIPSPPMADSLASVDTVKEKSEEEPLTFRERIKLWRGVESEEGLLRIILRPIPLSILPPVMFSFITGLSGSWFSVLLGISADIYGSAPYNFSVSKLGLLFIGGVPLSILSFIAGPMNDWTCKFMARHNRGNYEPEVRTHVAAIC